MTMHKQRPQCPRIKILIWLPEVVGRWTSSQDFPRDRTPHKTQRLVLGSDCSRCDLDAKDGYSMTTLSPHWTLKISIKPMIIGICQWRCKEMVWSTFFVYLSTQLRPCLSTQHKRNARTISWFHMGAKLSGWILFLDIVSVFVCRIGVPIECILAAITKQIKMTKVNTARCMKTTNKYVSIRHCCQRRYWEMTGSFIRHVCAHEPPKTYYAYYV